MKVTPMVKFILYAAVPVLAIYLLFRINTYAGIIGLAAWILLVVMSNRVLIYRFRGQAEYAKGNVDNAVKLFEKAVSFPKASQEMKVNYGFLLLKAGRLEESEKILQECTARGRSADERNMAKSNLAIVLWKKGQLDQAVTMLKEVIISYKTTAIYGSLGYMLIEQGDLDEALKFNLEALEYNPENPIILDNLGHLYYLRSEMERAGEMFQKLIEKNPHFPEAWYNYGRFLEDSGRSQEAAGMYQKALESTFSFNSTITVEQVQKRLDSLTGEKEENNQ
ncbi:MAG: tetratricopeptide repeat protein [Thermoclostridium sp.]|nr:tetratricopeptide repeat protein [Thermoclostridium sp.]